MKMKKIKKIKKMKKIKKNKKMINQQILDINMNLLKIIE
jgi:hypothetical protein